MRKVSRHGPVRGGPPRACYVGADAVQFPRDDVFAEEVLCLCLLIVLQGLFDAKSVLCPSWTCF